jgi:hypothetical protein
VNIEAAGADDDLQITYNDLTLKGHDVKQMVRKVEKTITRNDLKVNTYSYPNISPPIAVISSPRAA